MALFPCIKTLCKYIVFMFLGLRISTGCVYNSKKYNKGFIGICEHIIYRGIV